MKRICSALVALTVPLAAGLALAQANYPDKPIRILVGFSAGVAPDVTSRLFADKFNETWAKGVVVENVTGAGGNLAVERVAKSPPDGYTLAMGGNASLVINPNLMKLSYDPIKDFEYITQVFIVPNLVVVPPDVPAKTIQELIALAKSKPGLLRRRSRRHGHLAAPRRRAVHGDDRRQVPAGAVSRHDADPARPAGRTAQPVLRQHLQPSAAGARGQAARLRHHFAQALAADCRSSDHGGIGLPGFRRDGMVRPDGAGRYAASRSSTRSTRRPRR